MQWPWDKPLQRCMSAPSCDTPSGWRENVWPHSYSCRELSGTDASMHSDCFILQSILTSSVNIWGNGKWMRTMDVHHQWTKLFQQLSSYHSLHQQADWLKERISPLLGRTQVIHMDRLGPVQHIAEHYSSLSTFHRSLVSQPLRLHPRSLQGLTMLLEKYFCHNWMPRSHVVLLCKLLKRICRLCSSQWPL